MPKKLKKSTASSRQASDAEPDSSPEPTIVSTAGESAIMAKLEAVEKTMSKNFDQMKSKMEAMESEITELRKETKNIGAKMAAQSAQLQSVEEEVVKLKEAHKEQQEEVTKIKADIIRHSMEITFRKEKERELKRDIEVLNAGYEERMAHLEAKVRAKNMMIYSVPEDMEADNLRLFTENLIKNKVGYKEDFTIDSAQRIGRIPQVGGRSRPIVVKFQQEVMKFKVLRAAWQARNITVNDQTRIIFDHEYPKKVYNDRKKQVEMRKKFLEKKAEARILFPAKLKVRFQDGAEEIYKTPEEADQAYYCTTMRGMKLGRKD